MSIPFHRQKVTIKNHQSNLSIENKDSENWKVMILVDMFPSLLRNHKKQTLFWFCAEQNKLLYKILSKFCSNTKGTLTINSIFQSLKLKKDQPLFFRMNLIMLMSMGMILSSSFLRTKWLQTIKFKVNLSLLNMG